MNDKEYEDFMKQAEEEHYQDCLSNRRLDWKTYCPRCKKNQYVKYKLGFDYACHKCDLGFNVEVNCQADYEDVSYTHLWEDGTEDYQPSESDKYVAGWHGK